MLRSINFGDLCSAPAGPLFYRGEAVIWKQIPNISFRGRTDKSDLLPSVLSITLNAPWIHSIMLSLKLLWSLSLLLVISSQSTSCQHLQSARVVYATHRSRSASSQAPTSNSKYPF